MSCHILDVALAHFRHVAHAPKRTVFCLPFVVLRISYLGGRFFISYGLNKRACIDLFLSEFSRLEIGFPVSKLDTFTTWVTAKELLVGV